MSINFKDVKPEEFKLIPNSIIERVENDRFSRSFSGLNIDSTYFDLINQTSEDFTRTMKSIFDAVDIFDLQNNGLPQFYFVVILHAILAEGVLRSVPESYFISSANQESVEEVCIDNFNQSVNHVFRFLSGQFQEDDYLKVSNLIKDPEFYSFISLFLEPIGNSLENAVNDRVSAFGHLSSDYSITGQEMDCEQVRLLKLPLLSLDHMVSCETGFESVFGYPSVLTNFEYVTIEFAFTVTLDTVFKYFEFMKFFMQSQESFETLSAFYTKYLHLHVSLYPEKKPKKLVMISKIMEDYSEKIKAKQALQEAKEAREQKIKDRNEQRALFRAAQKEALALREAQKKEEARLESIKRQEMQAEQARLAEIEKKALLEQIAINEEKKALQAAELAEELYLEKLHFVIEKKQEILEQIDYFVTQLSQINDSSDEIQAFKEDIYIRLNSLKSSFLGLESVDLVELDTDLEIKIDSSKEECVEYIEMLNEQFIDLIS